jgi:hypothetical protein
MHCPRVEDEVQPGPRVSREKLRRQHVSLESITARARRDEIPCRVPAAMGDGVNVIERGEVDLEGGGAVDATAAAVTHRRALDRALLVTRWHVLGSARGPGNAGEGDVMKVPTS